MSREEDITAERVALQLLRESPAQPACLGKRTMDQWSAQTIVIWVVMHICAEEEHNSCHAWTFKSLTYCLRPSGTGLHSQPVSKKCPRQASFSSGLPTSLFPLRFNLSPYPEETEQGNNFFFCCCLFCSVSTGAGVCNFSPAVAAHIHNMISQFWNLVAVFSH